MCHQSNTNLLLERQLTGISFLKTKPLEQSVMALDTVTTSLKPPPKKATLSTNNGVLCFCPWRWFVGILCLSALVIVVNDVVGWPYLFDQWRHAKLPLLVAAFILFLISHVVRAQRINELILAGDLNELPAVTKISSWHQMANNLLPMRMGELALPLLMKRYYGYQWQHGIANLVWLRLYDAAVMGCLILSLISYNTASLLISAMMTIGTVSLVVLALTVGAKPTLDFVQRLHPLLAKLTKSFRETAPDSATKLLALTVFAWSCKITAVILAIAAVTSVSPLQALSGAIGAEFGALLPIHGIAGAGTFEASFVGAVKVVADITPEIVAAAINCHLFMLITTCSVALMFSVINTPKHSDTSLAQ